MATKVGQVVGVLVTGLVVAACARFPRASFDDDLCEGTAFHPEKKLVPSFDYAALHFGEEVSEAGSVCAKAANKDACLARVKAIEPDDTTWVGSRVRIRRYIVLTRGDDVFVLPKKDVRPETVLAPFDDVGRASVYAYFARNKGPMCGKANAARTKEGVKLLLASGQGCFGGSDEVVTVDATSGRIDVLEKLDHKQTCVGERESSKAEPLAELR